LQLADSLANTWWRVMLGHKGASGCLEMFRELQRKTVLPLDEPVKVIGITDEKRGKPIPGFAIFPRLSQHDYKILPCNWEKG
jgi:hypothetical protein